MIRRAAAAALLALLCAAGPAAAFEPLAVIGSPGTGAGQLGLPSGIAVHPQTGNLFVSEFDNDRVSEFEPDGTFVKAWGPDVIPGGATGFEICTTATGCKASAGTSGPGGLAGPSAIHAAPNGHLYVTELDDERISEFAADGTFVRAWGFDVIPGGGNGFEICTLETGCKNGVTGGGAGQFFAPTGLATDQLGRVWVAENMNQRVSVFAPAGEFLGAMGHGVAPGVPSFGTCTVSTGCQGGSSGGAPGQFSTPRAIVFPRTLEPAVVEQGGRVSVFAGLATFARAFGWDVVPGGGTELEICSAETGCKAAALGGGAGQLSSPRGGIAADPQGRLYIADTSNHRVSVFTPAGQFVHAFGFDVIPGGGAGFELCTAATSCKAGVAGAAPGQIDTPRGIAVGCRGLVYVADGGAGDRIQVFGEPGGSAKPCPLRLGAAKANRRKGTVKLAVSFPSVGELALKGRGVKRTKADVIGPGERRLKLKPRRSLRAELEAEGAVKVKVKATFLPPAGAAVKDTKKVRFRLTG